MKRFIAIAILAVLCSACSPHKDWVRQDRDNFYELDKAGLDRWIAEDAKLTVEQKEALSLMNLGRRARIKRGCASVGIPDDPRLEKEE